MVRGRCGPRAPSLRARGNRGARGREREAKQLDGDERPLMEVRAQVMAHDDVCPALDHPQLGLDLSGERGTVRDARLVERPDRRAIHVRRSVIASGEDENDALPEDPEDHQVQVSEERRVGREDERVARECGANKDQQHACLLQDAHQSAERSPTSRSRVASTVSGEGRPVDLVRRRSWNTRRGGSTGRRRWCRSRAP